jgi:hypothetical protein
MIICEWLLRVRDDGLRLWSQWLNIWLNMRNFNLTWSCFCVPVHPYDFMPQICTRSMHFCSSAPELHPELCSPHVAMWALLWLDLWSLGASPLEDGDTSPCSCVGSPARVYWSIITVALSSLARTNIGIRGRALADCIFQKFLAPSWAVQPAVFELCTSSARP